MGVAPDDVPRSSELLGKKLVLNEFVAFKHLTNAVKPGTVTGMDAFVQAGHLRPDRVRQLRVDRHSTGRDRGHGPERRGDLARLGVRALLGGFLATLINAAVAGVSM